MHIQSYLDYPDSVGQTHFLVCLYNPNCLDNKNALKLSQVLLLFFVSNCLPANAVLAGDISVGKPPRCYQITNFQLLADRQHDTFALPTTGGRWRSLALRGRHAQRSKRRVRGRHAQRSKRRAYKKKRARKR